MERNAHGPLLKKAMFYRSVPILSGCLFQQKSMQIRVRLSHHQYPELRDHSQHLLNQTGGLWMELGPMECRSTQLYKSCPLIWLREILLQMEMISFCQLMNSISIYPMIQELQK